LVQQLATPLGANGLRAATTDGLGARSSAQMPILYDWAFPIKEGEVVDAEAKGLWLPGIVTHILHQEHGETTFSVDYDVYAEEDGLTAVRIRRRTYVNQLLSALLAWTIGFPPGTHVVANRFGRGAWQPGTVNKVLRNGVYDIEYDDGQIEENVPPSRMRIAPGGLDPLGSLVLFFRSTFTTRGRLQALGIEYDVVAENHAVPTRFQVGDKIVMYGRAGIFTVTGFAGSSDATITLLGLARDSVQTVIDGGGVRAVSVVTAGDDDDRRAMKKKKKLSSLNNDDLKPMQFYYPQASWRLSEIQEQEVGAEVVCRRGGDGNEDGKQEQAIVISKVVNTTHKGGFGTSSLFNPFGGYFGTKSDDEFDPVNSTYEVKYVSDGAMETQIAKNVLSQGADGAPLAEGQPRYSLGENVTYAAEGADQWLSIVAVIEGQLTYNVTFEDGDKEFNLTSRHVRVRSDEEMSVDDRVEANFKNSGRLAKGKIDYKSEEDEFGMTLYDILYDNGEEEEDVHPSRIFTEEQPAKMKRKTQVYARRRSLSNWYAGSISEVKKAPMYKCTYMYEHTDEVTGERIPQGTVVEILETDLDSPLKPMRYTDLEGDLYRQINLAMFGRVEGESLKQPPRVLTATQMGELAELVTANPAEFWNALDPQIFRDIDRSFLHTVRDAQTDKRRKNYIDVTNSLFKSGITVPVDAFDFNGLTPLYLACVYSDEEIAWHLVENGADPLMPCIGLKTPAHLIMDSTFSLENTIVAQALQERRNFQSLDGRKRRVHYNFALLNPSFYDLEPNATPNCFIGTEDVTGDTRRHLGQGISPLRMMVNEGHTDLVDVPVVNKLLDEMWSQFTYQFQLADALAAYSTILLFLLVTTRLFGWADHQVGHDPRTWDWDSWVLVVAMVLIIVIVLVGTRDELYELQRLGYKRYTNNYWNVLEVLSYTMLCVTLALDLAMLLGYLPKEYSNCQDEDADLLQCVTIDVVQIRRRLMAIAAVLVWIRGIKYLTMWPRLGILVRMVEKMMSEVAVFGIVFAFVIAAWANAFTVIMQDAPPTEDEDAPNRFRNFGESLLMCARLSIGDFEFDDFTVFEAESKVMIALWLTFLAIGAVLMLNLLIAQLSNVYAVITENVEAEYLLSRASIIFNTQDQMLTENKHSIAGIARIEHLNLKMSSVTSQEAVFNRRESDRTKKNEVFSSSSSSSSVSVYGSVSVSVSGCMLHSPLKLQQAGKRAHREELGTRLGVSRSYISSFASYF